MPIYTLPIRCATTYVFVAGQVIRMYSKVHLFLSIIRNSISSCVFTIGRQTCRLLYQQPCELVIGIVSSHYQAVVVSGSITELFWFQQLMELAAADTVQI